MRVLLSGAAGFLGSHLADRLLAEGATVVAVDNLVTGTRANLAHLAGHRRFSLVVDDVTQPLAVEGPFDGVLHFASPASPVDYLRLPVETLRVGSAGTLNLLEVARRYGARFLLASTSEVYGDPLVHPQPERYWGNVNPVGPRSVYDEAKRFAEAATVAYQQAHGLDTRIARIFNTYGPRMRVDDGRVVSNFVVQALRGEPLTIHGDGAQTRAFCYVDDLVEGIWRLYRHDTALLVNLGSPDEVTVGLLADEVRRLTGAHVDTVLRPLPEDDPRVRRPDITLARTALGWAPRIPLEEGLRRTIDDVRARLRAPAVRETTV